MINRKSALLLFLGFFLHISFCFAQRPPNCSLASTFYSKDSINVITFGASTVAGVGGAGFQDYLKKNIQYCYSAKVTTISTFAIPGETTTEGLKRIDNAIAGKANFIFILMGANDAIRIAENKMSLSDTEFNMRQIVKKCLSQKLVVILGTVQNFNSSTTIFQKSNAIVAQINNIYKQIAKEYQLQVANINSVMARDSRLYSDVVHPNNRGYYLIGLVWFDALNKAIEANFLSLYISQNFPNPANTTTKITYTVPDPGIVQITLYDLTGRLIRYLLNEYANAGIYTREFDLSNLSNGLYIYVYRSAGEQKAMKLLVNR